MRRARPGAGSLGLALFALAVGLLSSGCYLRGLIVSVSFQGGGGGGYYDYDDPVYTITFGSESLVADCTFDDDFFDVGCLYFVYDEDGFLVESTSTAQLIADFGLFGALIDPLVLQVPQSVSGATGSVNNGIVPVPLVITQTNSFKAGPATTVTAEPGHQFLIVELPDVVADAISGTDALEGSELDITLQFTSATLPVAMKSMFTVRIDAPGATYYLPMLPCTTDFRDVPEISVGFTSAQSGEDEVRAMASDYAEMACDGRVYDLRLSPGPSEPGEHLLFAPGLAFN
jgi:hypothetical protein